MIQETAREWAVLQLLVRLRGRRHARAAARLRPRRPRGAALHVRALERQRLSRPTRRARRSRSPMRVVHLSHDMEAIGRLFSPDHALDAARDRRDRTYDPALADLFVEHGRAWFDRLARDRAVGRRARPRARAPPHAGRRGARRRPDRRRRLHRPQVAVHGRAQPPLRASSRPTPPGCSGSPRRTSPRSAARRSCTTSAPPSVPNSIWDKPGPLTRTEFDRVELHPMLTEQMLRRSPALAVLNPVASRAPREVRRVRLPQARASRRRRSRQRASWRRRRSTSG